jgi:AraC-like DNA-binding protein
MSVDLKPISTGERRRIRFEHISDWEGLIVEAHYSGRKLAARCGFSLRHLQRYMAIRFGTKLTAYILSIRMQKAYTLLKSGFSVKETALGLGFKQVAHFCRCFKVYYDTNPSSVLLNSGLPESDGAAGDQLELEFVKPRSAGSRSRTRKPRGPSPEIGRKKRRDRKPA